jgi:hypothetical protein
MRPESFGLIALFLVLAVGIAARLRFGLAPRHFIARPEARAFSLRA